MMSFPDSTVVSLAAEAEAEAEADAAEEAEAAAELTAPEAEEPHAARDSDMATARSSANNFFITIFLFMM